MVLRAEAEKNSMTERGSIGFSIGEVSRAVGLAPQTLRLWEREGLIQPRRTGSGYRLYRESDVERLKEIKYLRKSEGLNFAAIRKQSGEPAGHGDGSVERGPESRDHPPAGSLGERLRRLRQRAHKTLSEVSEATGLSISFISALERGGSGASISSLRLLAGAYGVNARRVFGADLPQDSTLVRGDERPAIDWDNGVRLEELATGEGSVNLSYARVPPGTGSEGFHSHEGEEFVYVVYGSLHVELKDRDPYKLGPGDTLYLPSTTLHRWWAGEEPVEAIYVNISPAL